jgi:hypothetical protein
VENIDKFIKYYSEGNDQTIMIITVALGLIALFMVIKKMLSMAIIVTILAAAYFIIFNDSSVYINQDKINNIKESLEKHFLDQDKKESDDKNESSG